MVSRLSGKLDHAHLSCHITSIEPDASNPVQATICCESNGERRAYHGFDHIIFATQATRAVPLLATYASKIRTTAPGLHNSLESIIDCLTAFTYHRNVVINHTDTTLMPDNPKDWRDLNLIVADAEYPDSSKESNLTVPPSFSMTSHVLAGSSGRQVFQTTNPVILPREDTVLSVSYLERAVLTLPAKRALQGLYQLQDPIRPWAWETAVQKKSKLGPLQGAGRSEYGAAGGPGIWMCGSYAAAGIPLLEGCVVSARNVVEQGVFRSEGTSMKAEPW